jgi:hypothetical protein
MQTALSEHDGMKLTLILSTAQLFMTSFVRNHFPVTAPLLEASKVPPPPATDADSTTNS